MAADRPCQAEVHPLHEVEALPYLVEGLTYSVVDLLAYSSFQEVVLTSAARPSSSTAGQAVDREPSGPA